MKSNLGQLCEHFMEACKIEAKLDETVKDNGNGSPPTQAPVRQILFNQKLKGVLKDMQCEYKAIDTILNELRDTLRKKRFFTENMMKLVDEYNKLDDIVDATINQAKETDGINKRNIVKKRNINKMKINAKKENKIKGEQEKENRLNTYDSKEKLLSNENRKRRIETNEITEPNDSKWTLKYPEKVKGVIELKKGSGVYVELTGLRNCVQKSKNSKTLAILLLDEIFTKEALETCLLVGHGSNSSRTRSAVLDKHALTVMLNYVDRYAKGMEWVPPNKNTILESLSNKIQQMTCFF